MDSSGQDGHHGPVSSPAQTLSMHLKNVTLSNFRCFENERFHLDRRLNLVIGNNAKGKSALLDGIAVALGGFLLGIPAPTVKSVARQATTRPIRHEDMRRFFAAGKEVATPEVAGQTRVEAEAELQDAEGHSHHIDWFRERSGPRERPTNKHSKRLRLFAERLYHDSNQSGATLPVIAYYGTGRLGAGQTQRLADLAQANTALGYYYCLNPDAPNKTVHEWIRHMALIANERGRPLLILQAVYHAICRLLPNATGAWYSSEYGELVVEFGDAFFPFTDLSDGQRSMAALTGDLAWRCAHLNQHFGETAAQQTPGVVLIDEIDLFIHPSWQRDLLPTLLRTFPKVQFIVTTHSPFILQSVKEAHVINLDHLHDAKRSPSLRAERSVEDIAEEIMGVEHVQRSKAFQELTATAAEYYRLLDEGVPESAEAVARLAERLDALEERFGDNPAYVAFLKSERRKRLEER